MFTITVLAEPISFLHAQDLARQCVEDMKHKQDVYWPYVRAPDKVRKINFSRLYLCYFLTKSYV